MSLQTRLAALITAFGADVKTLTTRLDAEGVPATINLVSGTDKITSITVSGDNTPTAGWPNRWEWLFKPFGGTAQLTQWVNEYGELRLVPARESTVAFRIFGKQAAADPARTASVMEVRDDRVSNNVTFALEADGTLVTAGPISRAVPSGPTLKTGYLQLAVGAAVPANTPAGTLIVRT